MTAETAGGPVGQVRPITYYGEDVLHRPCAEVTRDTPDLDQLIADMFASMYAAEGVGLAANQIGVGLRIFVIDCPEQDDEGRPTGHSVVGTVINPVLHLPDGHRELVERTEGCLSVPGATAVLARVSEARVTGFDANWEPIEISGTGLVARCLQHECDHLEGTVYVDRLPKRARKQALADADFSRGA
ncbi:peptide deformylase [Sporichthya polymorpha]|uniref:peptide deformylase n=1 Tax=Sporichthya polymorpha TaxID=35751 RepID=UPI00038179DE|nr:peptide deformylase [Sporichthya polymorpha]